jgi:predicted RNase H-like nuclease (RuvC/YqgF family)
MPSNMTREILAPDPKTLTGTVRRFRESLKSLGEAEAVLAGEVSLVKMFDDITLLYTKEMADKQLIEDKFLSLAMHMKTFQSQYKNGVRDHEMLKREYAVLKKAAQMSETKHKMCLKTIQDLQIDIQSKEQECEDQGKIIQLCKEVLDSEIVIDLPVQKRQVLITYFPL